MGWGTNSEYRYGEAGRKGDDGENIVESFLKSQNINYEKKTDRHSQVVKKIDFVVEDVPMDVKTNIYNGYMAVEVYDPKGNKGWLYTTTAEQIYAVDRAFCSIYRYNISDMKVYVEKNQHKLKASDNGAYLLWVSTKENFVERLQ